MDDLRDEFVLESDEEDLLDSDEEDSEESFFDSTFCVSTLGFSTFGVGFCVSTFVILYLIICVVCLYNEIDLLKRFCLIKKFNLPLMAHSWVPKNRRKWYK